MDEKFNFDIKIAGESISQDELYDLGIRLKRELHDMGIDDVNFIKNETLASGAKSIDPVLVGALAIAVLPPTITKLLEFLQAWTMRQQSRMIKLKIQVDSIEMEIPETMSPAELEKWIDTLKRNLKKK